MHTIKVKIEIALHDTIILTSSLGARRVFALVEFIYAKREILASHRGAKAA